MHARMHAHMHTCMHTCTHTRMHTPCMHTSTHTCTHTHMHAHMHARMHACSTHSLTSLIHTYTCTHTHTHTHARTHTHTHARTHARTHTHTETYQGSVENFQRILKHRTHFEPVHWRGRYLLSSDHLLWIDVPLHQCSHWLPECVKIYSRQMPVWYWQQMKTSEGVWYQTLVCWGWVQHYRESSIHWWECQEFGGCLQGEGKDRYSYRFKLGKWLKCLLSAKFFSQ